MLTLPCSKWGSCIAPHGSVFSSAKAFVPALDEHYRERLLSGICYSHLSDIVAFFSPLQENGSLFKPLPFVTLVPYVSDLISHFARCLFFFVVCARVMVIDLMPL